MLEPILRWSAATAVAAVFAICATTSPAVAQSQDMTCSVSANRATAAGGVEQREPIGTEGPFVADGSEIYVFLDVDNANEEPVVLTLTWTNTTTERSFERELEAGVSSRWRTWAYHTMNEYSAGHWQVRVTDPDGCSVAVVEFDVQAAPGTARRRPSITVVLCTPPPDTNTRSGPGSANRSMASAILRTVSDVAVATMSASPSPVRRPSLINASA